MTTARTVPTFVLDSGALIALEKASPSMTALLLTVRAGDARLIVPDSVLAQVWRTGSGRQARIGALLGLQPEQCRTVPLDTVAAKRIGVQIAECGHGDVVDVHVAITARDAGAAVITSDPDDIVAVMPALKNFIVRI